MKMQTIFAVVMAAAMMPNLASAAWQETTYTKQVNGVEWKFLIDEEAHTAALGLTQSAGSSGEAATTDPLSGKVIVPEAFMIDGVSYRVVNIGNRAFANSRDSGNITALTFPGGIEQVWDAVFYNYNSIESICFKGPVTVAAGTQETVTLSGAGLQSKSNRGTPALKTVFVGPHVKHSTSGSNDFIEFKCAIDCTYFFPRNDDGNDWPSTKVGGTNPKVIYYGLDEELDFKMGETTLTATVRTANALTNVLNHVATFKNDFGLDTKINVTNCIEVASDLITAENMQYATFNSLVLKVTTQEQLTGILSVIPDSVPLAIDASDAKVELTLPQGREIYVRVSAEGRQGKYTPKINGLMITFH